jgi:hypothetical protein
MRKEVSRRHVLLRVDPEGAVWVESLGREPVAVNGKLATEPTELFSGDQVEVRPGGQAPCANALVCSSCVSGVRHQGDSDSGERPPWQKRVQKLDLSDQGQPSACHGWSGEAAVLRALS